MREIIEIKTKIYLKYLKRNFFYGFLRFYRNLKFKNEKL